MPRVLYIGQAPAEGTGSPVIVLRHLQRLAAAGWEITVVAEEGCDNSASIRAGWLVLPLPLRRAWWPPFRPALAWSRAVRTWLLANEALRLTARSRPDAVLGYLAAHDDFLAEVAVRFARRSRAPLTLLVHDDPAAFVSDPREKSRLHRRHARLLAAARHPLFVSPELAALYRPPSSAVRILPPLPAGWPAFTEWSPALNSYPKIYYAGFVWPAQYPLLRKIALALAEAGAQLVLLTRETPELLAFLRANPVLHVPPFATNREALAHLAEHAAGILVSYADSVAQMPWIATSFPSKLVEQVQLGLPCAIVAPVESSVARWARRVGYADSFAPAELGRLAAWARDLRAESAWRHRAAPVRQLAAGEFAPEKIQSAFAASLLRK